MDPEVQDAAALLAPAAVVAASAVLLPGLARYGLQHDAAAPAAVALGAVPAGATGWLLTRRGSSTTVRPRHPSPRLAAVLAARTPQRGVRDLARTGVAHAVGRRERPARTMLTTRGGAPAAAREACAAAGAADVALLMDADPRRRPVLLVTAGPVDLAVKVERPAYAAEERGQREQRVLLRLADLRVGGIPRPRGAGRAGPLRWSAETLLPGVPLSAPAACRATAAQALAAWTLDLAVRTVAPRAVPPTMALRGAARALDAQLAGLVAVPCVTTHGDLASGGNVLARDRGVAVLDWETAREDGLPLTDALPSLALLLARGRGALDPQAQASYVLDLCRDGGPEGRWLRDHVRALLLALGVPLALGGPLSALAWGYQASMPEVHAEQVRAAGDEVPGWTSAAEHVLHGWLADAALGTTWSALVQGR